MFQKTDLENQRTLAAYLREGLLSLRRKAEIRLRSENVGSHPYKCWPNYIVTRYYEGLSSVPASSLGERFLPLTINRQLIEFQGDSISHNGSHVPYNTPRAAKIWEATEKATGVLGLHGYAGIDLLWAIWQGLWM